MSNATIETALATFTVEIVKVTTATDDGSISPAARERQAARHGGTWEQGVRTHWELRFFFLGEDVTEFVWGPGRFSTKKAAAAYAPDEEIATIRELLWDVRPTGENPAWELAYLALVQS